ncbi:hypothetical protein [Bradyrhizobium pachyrhizi]|uniref:hypothetical protein n=1 Tax=Bradyrhizobium pachyrhizi TaxID=280333 RepID=UPI00067AD3B2|nr:hypothetical protein [Bradyrhizobium pachyrhizi]
MDNNIIRFPQRLGERRFFSDSDRDPRAHEERRRHIEQMKLRDLQMRYKRSADDGHLKWTSREDRLRAAQALGLLIHKEGRNDATIAAMKSKWRKLNSDSEFHMHRYSISPTIDLANPTIFEEQANKIKTRFVRPYAERARFIANIKGLDPDESEISIFRHSSYWRSPSRSDRANDEEGLRHETADKLAFLLQELCARVIRESDLAALFARLRRIPARWDGHRASFHVADESMTCLNLAGYQDWIDMWDAGPPLPSVPLVRLWHAGLTFPICLCQESCTEPTVTPTAEDLAQPITECEERQANLDIYREIGLVLAPAAADDTCGAMFETRAHARLNVLDDNGEILSQGPLDAYSTNNLSSLGPEHSARVLLGDAWRKFVPLVTLDQNDVEEDLAATAAALSGVTVNSPFMWDITPLADDKQCMEQYWLSWTPVDAEHVAHWLDRARDDRHQPVELLDHPTNPSIPRTETWFPWHVFAQRVEVAIYDGRLEAALRGAVASIREAFDTYESQWKSRMQQQTADRIARLRDDLLSGNDTTSPSES